MFEKIEELLAPISHSNEYSILRYNDPKNKVGYRITFRNPIAEIDADTEEELFEKAIAFLQPLYDARIKELKEAEEKQKELDEKDKEAKEAQ